MILSGAASPYTGDAAGPSRLAPVYGDAGPGAGRRSSSFVTRPSGDDGGAHQPGRRPTTGDSSVEPAKTMMAVQSALASYRPIRLDELHEATLMDRTDTKFLLPFARVTEFLGLVEPEYRVLTVEGARMGKYETLYLDTEDLAFYRAHQAGRPNRLKIRVRTYRTTGDRFVELKLTRAGRTAKTRAAVEPGRGAIESLLSEVSPSFNVPDANRIIPIVRVGYSRVTLVAKSAAERVTIDWGLDLALVGGASGNGAPSRAFFARSAIVEVKQPRHGTSPALTALRGMGIRPRSISKYCVGIASLVPGVKANRFRRTLDWLSRLEDCTDA